MPKRKLKVALTGADGFIGRHVLLKLRQAYSIVVLTGDVRQNATWRKKFDVLIHMAAATTGNAKYGEADFYSINVGGTLRALEACQRNKARMVFLSTSGVYRPQRKALRESDPADPPSTYAATKWMAEHMCRSYAASGDVKSVILRLFNVYGPGQDKRFLVPYLSDCLTRNTTARVKHLTSFRDYIFIDDVVSAIMCAVELRTAFGVYNVGTGKASSVRDVVACLERIGNKRMKIQKEKAPADLYPYVKAEIGSARKNLHWEPVVSLSDGLRQLLNA